MPLTARCSHISAMLAACIAVSASPSARADVVTIGASADSTLIESDNGTRANGSGDFTFAGRTLESDGSLRRTLLSFDIAGAVPAGSTITAVTLRLYMSRGISSPAGLLLHRVDASWGEGPSDPQGEEGAGAPAEPNDSTWTYRFYNTQSWANPGGDFVAQHSAVSIVGGEGFATWTGAAMTADVQGWLNTPAANFGWILIGDEEGPAPTAKRFDSRTNPVVSQRPALVIEYTVPGPATASLLLAAAMGMPRRRRPR